MNLQEFAARKRISAQVRHSKIVPDDGVPSPSPPPTSAADKKPEPLPEEQQEEEMAAGQPAETAGGALTLPLPVGAEGDAAKGKGDEPTDVTILNVTPLEESGIETFLDVSIEERWDGWL